MFHGLQIASHPTVSVSFVQKMFRWSMDQQVCCSIWRWVFFCFWQVANAWYQAILTNLKSLLIAVRFISKVKYKKNSKEPHLAPLVVVCLRGGYSHWQCSWKVALSDKQLCASKLDVVANILPTMFCLNRDQGDTLKDIGAWTTDETWIWDPRLSVCLTQDFALMSLGCKWIML